MKNQEVYLCMSTDVINNGHIKIIRNASKLGNLTIGVLTDRAIIQYKRFPLIDYNERIDLIQSIKGVSRIVKQDSIDYRDNLLEYRPDIVVHGDDWKIGPQSAIRLSVINTLNEIGGKLVEFPYTHLDVMENYEKDSRKILSMPEKRRPRLKQMLAMKPLLTIMEAHNGLTGLIVENTVVSKGTKIIQFDGMWISSLCDSTAKGKPDIELVDSTSRLNTINEIMEVTTKPIILDGDTGGLVEHFKFLVKTLERIGVSAVIIEDKVGLKRNSLFGTDVEQKQATIDEFCEKIAAGKCVQTTKDFMIIARIESLILKQGMDDALMRAESYVKAGADGIMIHSKEKDPNEIIEFIQKFRTNDMTTPIAIVPTTFSSIDEDTWEKYGVNIVIYANHLIRSAFPAMKKVTEMILTDGKCERANELCMPIKEIITLIPNDD